MTDLDPASVAVGALVGAALASLVIGWLMAMFSRAAADEETTWIMYAEDPRPADVVHDYTKGSRRDV